MAEQAINRESLSTIFDSEMATLGDRFNWLSAEDLEDNLTGVLVAINGVLRDEMVDDFDGSIGSTTLAVPHKNDLLDGLQMAVNLIKKTASNRKYTPEDIVLSSAAMINTALILLHPFRSANGRTARVMNYVLLFGVAGESSKVLDRIVVQGAEAATLLVRSQVEDIEMALMASYLKASGKDRKEYPSPKFEQSEPTEQRLSDLGLEDGLTQVYRDVGIGCKLAPLFVDPGTPADTFRELAEAMTPDQEKELKGEFVRLVARRYRMALENCRPESNLLNQSLQHLNMKNSSLGLPMLTRGYSLRSHPGSQPTKGSRRLEP